SVGVAVAGAVLVIVLGIVGYPSLNARDNHLAHDFAEDILRSVPQDGVLLAESDVVVLPVAYLQAVEHARPDVTLVMAGPLARGDWYVRELRAIAPTLTVPFDRYSPAGGATIHDLVAANPRRPFILIGAPPDGSLEPAYWFLPHGLGLAI